MKQFVKTASNHTLYAKWEINQYSISFVAEGVTVDTITNNYGGTITVSEFSQVLEKEGYRFVDWEKQIDEETKKIIIKPIYEEEDIKKQFTITSVKVISYAKAIITAIGGIGVLIVGIILLRKRSEVELNGKKYMTIEEAIKIIQESIPNLNKIIKGVPITDIL